MTTFNKMTAESDTLGIEVRAIQVHRPATWENPSETYWATCPPVIINTGNYSGAEAKKLVEDLMNAIEMDELDDSYDHWHIEWEDNVPRESRYD